MRKSYKMEISRARLTKKVNTLFETQTQWTPMRLAITLKYRQKKFPLPTSLPLPCPGENDNIR